jgi:LuxR family maltose regulon positive regulatory protein
VVWLPEFEGKVPKQLFHSNAPITPGNQIYLERPRIDRLLEQALQKRLVIVSAGAGYGKTYAVYSFVRRLVALTSWIQLSERDNISDRFWENFVAAVTQINTAAAARLSKIDFPVTERQIDRYMAIPRTEVRSDLKYVFVYDDFHFIQDPAVLRFMEKSLTSTFPNITSVLISRTEPPLNLMAFESKGYLARITEEDLRFTREEMTAYFGLLGVTPSPQTLASIYHDTEGWAFAIHLAGLSLKNTPSGAVYLHQALRSNIFKLIDTEIMAPLPPPVQRFLIKLSLIDHLAPDLLEELVEDDSMLEQLRGLDSFVRFDVYLNAYHIHHLLLDYLKNRQDELTEYDKKDLWHKAAAWCAVNGQKLDAINYYEKAGDYERLIDVIYTLPLLFPNRIARMLVEIMERAPAEVFDQVTAAWVIYTHLCLALEQYDKVRKDLTAVTAKLETRPSSLEVNRALMGCYNSLGFLGMITSPLTRNYDYAHYFERARHYYERTPFETKPPVSVMAQSSYICRVISEEPGEMERYIEGLAGMVAQVPYSTGGCTLGLDDLARAELSFYRGDLAEAERFALRSLRNAREGQQYEIENRGLFYLMRIYLARGNYEAIQDILKQLEAQLDEPHYLNRFTYHDIFMGWYYIRIGQVDKLASWLKNDFEESDLNSIVFGQEIIVKARYHVAEKRYPAALAVLDGWETRNSPWVFVLGKIEVKALEAVCRYQLKDKGGAYAALGQAWHTASPHAIVMPFWELGKDMRALADAAIKDHAAGLPRDWLEKLRLGAAGYAKRLFAVAEQGGSAVSRKGEAEQGARLSRRETEVLMSLSQGMTREEIAAQASLSVNTVKSIIRSIYLKLGAVNKADAVRIAAARGIVGTGHDDRA